MRPRADDPEVIGWCSECLQPFTSRAAYAGHRDHECPGGELIMADETETETDGESNPDVAWAGGSSYVVRDAESFFRVHLNGGEVESVFDDSMTEAKRASVQRALEAAPASPTFDDRIAMAHIELVSDAIGIVNDAQDLVSSGAVAAGGSGGGSAGSGDDDDEFESDIQTNVTMDHDYDESDLIESVDQWIQNYTDLPDYSHLDTDYVELDVVQVDVPEAFDTEFAGETVVAVLIDLDPFGTDYWDSSNGEWADKDGWDEVRDELRNITQGSDHTIWFGEPDWVNVFPAEAVEENLGGD